MFAARKSNGALWGCVILASCVLTSLPSVASAASFYSTGTNVSGGLDQDWLVSTGYNGNFNTSNFVQATSWAHGSETWITDTLTGPQYQFFTFRQYFNLTAFEASTANLQFYWGCDDIPGAVGFTPVYSINGGTYTGAGSCTGYNIGTNLVTIASGFVSGQNYIDFRVEGNYATNGMGLKTVSFTTGTDVPEPGTLALLGLGLAGLAFAGRRRP